MKTFQISTKIDIDEAIDTAVRTYLYMNKSQEIADVHDLVSM